MPKPISEKFWKDATYRRTRRVFQLAHELHKVGYQRLRVWTGTSPSGAYYRVGLGAIIAMDEQGLLPSSMGISSNPEIRGPQLTVEYSSSQNNNYFGWPDGPGKSARQLANLFVLRFPELCEASFGDDWAYAGWFTRLLGEIENGWFPTMYGDSLLSYHGDGIAMNQLVFSDKENSRSETKTFELPPYQKAISEPDWQAGFKDIVLEKLSGSFGLRGRAKTREISEISEKISTFLSNTVVDLCLESWAATEETSTSGPLVDRLKQFSYESGFNLPGERGQSTRNDIYLELYRNTIGLRKQFLTYLDGYPLHKLILSGECEPADVEIHENHIDTTEEVYGWTPLHIAARNQMEPVVRVLIENGANIEARDRSGRTALQNLGFCPFVGALSYERTMKYIIRNTKDFYPPILLGFKNSKGEHETLEEMDRVEQIIDLLVEAGLDPNDEDANGNTTLKIATLEAKNVLVALALLKRGVDFGGMSLDNWGKVHKVIETSWAGWVLKNKSLYYKERSF